jgi:hypothetical protein
LVPFPGLLEQAGFVIGSLLGGGVDLAGGAVGGVADVVLEFLGLAQDGRELRVGGVSA